MTNIASILEQAASKTVVVLGDLMLDEWIIGDASRISPEAPVPVVKWAERRIAPGGAANVVMNLRSLGAQVHVAGVVGDDEAGRSLLEAMQNAGAKTDGIYVDKSRLTTLKTRVLASRQQMLRIDRECDEPFSDENRQAIEARLMPLLKSADVLCISDYDKGLVTCGVAELARGFMKARNAHVTAGPKPHNLDCFAHSDFVSLNEKEAAQAAGLKINSDDDALRAGELLREQLDCRALAMTRGGKGVLLLQDGAKPRALPGHPVEVFDVAGAGDTFLSAATLALACGQEYSAACHLGNLAAAASVSHVGVVAVTPEEVLRFGSEA